MFSCRRAGSQEAPEPGRTFFWSCTRLPLPQAARGRPRDEGMSAVRSPDRHRRRLHEVSAGRTEGARNSISLVQPPYHAEPEMTTRTCAFAHRLFPELRHRCRRQWPTSSRTQRLASTTVAPHASASRFRGGPAMGDFPPRTQSPLHEGGVLLAGIRVCSTGVGVSCSTHNPWPVQPHPRAVANPRRARATDGVDTVR